MLIRKKNKNIIKNNIYRIQNLSNLKINNLKSHNIELKYIILNNIYISKTKSIKKKICINTGRYSSTNKKFNITRQQINSRLIKNQIDNINIASW